jgi:asparagine synthase (glutamine-hydrolysing)
MCGINGFMIHQKLDIDVEYILTKMNQKIIHRGPDAEGIYINENAAIGMRRLSVIDLSHGDQPIFNETKDLCIVFNGEIYNYKELKAELLKVGHVFSTESDTEVILHGYEEYGTNIIEQLNGMFVFCIYDMNANRFILARDRTGQKPLYYYSNKEHFVFASEIKIIVEVWDVPRIINKKALNLYLGLTYIPSPYSIYQDIFKLEPGSYMLVDSSGIQRKTYWALEIPLVQREDKNIGYLEKQEKLKALVYDSIKRQMVSDVPLGAFLSGGIDSSIVVGVMSELSDEPINTFSIGFESKDFDERDRAEIVAKHNGTNHHVKVLDYDDALLFIDKILESMSEPFADSSSIPMYYLSEFAKEYVTVVLTGDAGDELFGGYTKYLIGHYSKGYHKVPRFIRKYLIEPALRSFPIDNEKIRKARKLIMNSEKTPYEQYLGLMCLGFQDRKGLLQEGYFNIDAFEGIRANFEKTAHGTDLQKSQFSDVKTVLEGDMLVKVDRMSMLHSIETRVPLLDNRIIDYAFTLHDKDKIKGKNTKRILKDTFKDVIPDEVFNKSKHGFGVPIGEWFRGPLKGRLLEFLSEDRIVNQGIFNYPFLEKVLDEHMSKKADHASALWAIFVFQYWYYNKFEGGLRGN